MEAKDCFAEGKMWVLTWQTSMRLFVRATKWWKEAEVDYLWAWLQVGHLSCFRNAPLCLVSVGYFRHPLLYMQVTCLLICLSSRYLCEISDMRRWEAIYYLFTLNSPPCLHSVSVGIGEVCKTWNSLSGICKILRAKMAFSVMSGSDAVFHWQLKTVIAYCYLLSKKARLLANAYFQQNEIILSICVTISAHSIKILFRRD